MAMTKSAFTKKGDILINKLNIELEKNFVKCYICCRDLYGSETWSLRNDEEMPGNVWNLLLKKNGKYKMNRNCTNEDVKEEQMRTSQTLLQFVRER